MLVKTNDGEIYRAKNATDLVRSLHETSLSPAEDEAAFMRQTAERTIAQTGAMIRCDSADEFVEDLFLLGLLETVPEGKED